MMQLNLTHDGRDYAAWTPAQLIAAGVPQGVVLGAFRSARKSEIDKEAERQRLHWITPGAGQAMTYARKVEEAKAVLAAADPVPADYPMLAASIGIDGADIVAVATTVLAMDAAWAQTGAAIEATRLRTKNNIDQASDIAAVLSITAAWPQPAA
ncbi:hypothetical protein ASE63_22495 [Bosea sp. Root381]|uniref:hypothetical protein n=1 Tax=Bosea sp. Root381 TaxID=1736524 RepID=UPI0006F6BCA3|nr:hypothetical protein [Bosea sp. Root381]KRE07472.1 hypothetical protein ASE63_22495 [Bosea sp. Root381]